MDLAINFLVIIVMLAVLVKGADLVCNAFIFIAKKLKFNEFLLGFIVLGLLTSIPEISVAVNSINNQVPQLSVGNLLGASLVLVTLIMGLHAFLKGGLPFHGKYNSHEAVVTILIIAMPIIVLIDQELSSGEGLLLMLSYVIFAFHLRGLFQKKNAVVHNYSFIVEKPRQTAWYLLQAVLGIAAIIISSDQIVDRSIVAAQALGIDVGVIGIFVLAIGTNLPELAILIRSRKMEAERFAAGNFLGSATVNTLVIGFIGLVSPFKASNFVEISSVIILLGLASLLFIYFEQTNQSGIKRHHGLMLIGVYVALIVAELVTRVKS